MAMMSQTDQAWLRVEVSPGFLLRVHLPGLLFVGLGAFTSLSPMTAGMVMAVAFFATTFVGALVTGMENLHFLATLPVMRKRHLRTRIALSSLYLLVMATVLATLFSAGRADLGRVTMAVLLAISTIGAVAPLALIQVGVKSLKAWGVTTAVCIAAWLFINIDWHFLVIAFGIYHLWWTLPEGFARVEWDGNSQHNWEPEFASFEIKGLWNRIPSPRREVWQLIWNQYHYALMGFLLLAASLFVVALLIRWFGSLNEGLGAVWFSVWMFYVMLCVLPWHTRHLWDTHLESTMTLPVSKTRLVRLDLACALLMALIATFTFGGLLWIESLWYSPATPLGEPPQYSVIPITLGSALFIRGVIAGNLGRPVVKQIPEIGLLFVFIASLILTGVFLGWVAIAVLSALWVIALFIWIDWIVGRWEA